MAGGVGRSLSGSLSPRPLNAARPAAAGTLNAPFASLPVGVSMSASAPDPSTAPSPARFREAALASGLVQPGQVEAAEREVRMVLDAVACESAAWDQAVADKLVAQGLLTKFQAREMLAGRRRFRLGQYTVLDEIGRGGMGQVFLAEHAMMGRHVALKVLPRAKSTPEYEAAFQREIRVLARLDHENLVRASTPGTTPRCITSSPNWCRGSICGGRCSSTGRSTSSRRRR